MLRDYEAGAMARNDERGVSKGSSPTNAWN
jgi:hypothetical protein